uniref:Putative secreted protein n=1 Tax=Anopheles darlingi TaxID=43151 RepID=A0A2M4D9Y1_ANODA
MRHAMGSPRERWLDKRRSYLWGLCALALWSSVLRGRELTSDHSRILQAEHRTKERVDFVPSLFSLSGG